MVSVEITKFCDYNMKAATDTCNQMRGYIYSNSLKYKTMCWTGFAPWTIVC